MKRTTIARVALAGLLPMAIAAHADPIRFEFTATVTTLNWAGNPDDPGAPSGIPAPYTDIDWAFAAPISGTFTIESTAVGNPAFINLNGVRTEAGSRYANAVTQLSVNVGDQLLDFSGTTLPGGPDDYFSSITVIDLPVPSNQPTTNYDSYNINVSVGPGLFDGSYSQVAASFGLVWSERDLDVITSRDMVANLVYSPNWFTFVSLYDDTNNSFYQIAASVTSLRQVDVPEPGTLALFASALGIVFLGRRRRQAQ